MNSSPKKGPKRGIEPLVAGGTSKRWWIDCQACGDPFEMSWDRLDFQRDGTALEAAQSVYMACPHEGCGGVHYQRHKRALMATGRWIGRGERAVPGGKEGDLEPNSTDSYWWDGTFGLAPWGVLARQYRTAELRFEEHQDEGPLKSFFQTKAPENRSRGTNRLKSAKNWGLRAPSCVWSSGTIRASTEPTKSDTYSDGRQGRDASLDARGDAWPRITICLPTCLRAVMR